MTSKFSRLSLALAVLFAIPAIAQTDGPTSSAAAPSAPLPSAPSASSPSPTTPAPISITGTKVGAINIEGAIFGCNEGQKEMQTLSKKYEPRQTELKGKNDELEALKKQLNDQGPKLNEDALATLKKQIETKQKEFDRAYQDYQDEAGSQQQEIANNILKKMAPLIVKYAQENGYGMIIDTSKPWPQSPILIAGEGVDITKPVVDLYNAQSGVAAPSAGTTTRPAAPRTGTGTGTAKPPSAPKQQ
jgi:outer membrane protein